MNSTIKRILLAALLSATVIAASAQGKNAQEARYYVVYDCEPGTKQAGAPIAIGDTLFTLNHITPQKSQRFGVYAYNSNNIFIGKLNPLKTSKSFNKRRRASTKDPFTCPTLENDSSLVDTVWLAPSQNITNTLVAEWQHEETTGSCILSKTADGMIAVPASLANIDYGNISLNIFVLFDDGTKALLYSDLQLAIEARRIRL